MGRAAPYPAWRQALAAADERIARARAARAAHLRLQDDRARPSCGAGPAHDMLLQGMSGPDDAFSSTFSSFDWTRVTATLIPASSARTWVDQSGTMPRLAHAPTRSQCSTDAPAPTPAPAQTQTRAQTQLQPTDLLPIDGSDARVPATGIPRVGPTPAPPTIHPALRRPAPAAPSPEPPAPPTDTMPPLEDQAKCASPREHARWDLDHTTSITENSTWQPSPRMPPPPPALEGDEARALAGRAGVPDVPRPPRWRRLGSQDVTDPSIDVTSESTDGSRHDALGASGTSGTCGATDASGVQDRAGVTMSLSELGVSQGRPVNGGYSGRAGALALTGRIQNSTCTGSSSDAGRARAHGLIPDRPRSRPPVLQFAPPSSANDPLREREPSPSHTPPSPLLSTSSLAPPPPKHTGKRNRHALQLAPVGTKRPRAAPRVNGDESGTSTGTGASADHGSAAGVKGTVPGALTKMTLPGSVRTSKVFTLRAHLEWVAARCPAPPRTLSGALVRPAAANRAFVRGLLSMCAVYFLVPYDQRLFDWVNRVLSHGAAVVEDLARVPASDLGGGGAHGTHGPGRAWSENDDVVAWHGLRYPSSGAGDRRLFILSWYSSAKARAELHRTHQAAAALPIARFEWLTDSIEHGSLLLDPLGVPLSSYLL